MIDKVWLLSEEEFLVLASACEIKSIWGFRIDMNEIAREKVIYSIQSLQQRGFLEFGDSIRAIGEMQDIFQTIREADSTMEIRKMSGRACIIYFGENIVRITKSMRREKTYEVALLEMDQVWNYLTDEGWIINRRKTE